MNQNDIPSEIDLAKFPTCDRFDRPSFDRHATSRSYCHKRKSENLYSSLVSCHTLVAFKPHFVEFYILYRISRIEFAI